MREISLTIASKEVPELVNEVEQGESFVMTRRGRPIAKLTPHCADRMVGPAWAAAYRRMMAFLDEGARLGCLRANREDLYDR
jgi:prevent-host-death family protein